MRRVCWAALTTPELVKAALEKPDAWVEFTADAQDDLAAPAHDIPGSGGWIRVWDQRHHEPARVEQALKHGFRYRARMLLEIP